MSGGFELTTSDTIDEAVDITTSVETESGEIRESTIRLKRSIYATGSGSAVGVPYGTAFPGAPTEPHIFWRTDTEHLHVWDGEEWKQIDESGTGSSDPDAIHDNVDGEINLVAEKGTPVDADIVLIEDSAGSYAKKKVQLSNLPGGDGVTDALSWTDDFVGDELEEVWNATAGSGGTAPTPDATGENNGTVDMVTGTTTGGWSRLRFNRMHFKADLSATIRSILKISDVSECDAYMGFQNATDKYAFFHISAGDVWLRTDDGEVSTEWETDSGYNATDNAYLTLSVELDDTETAVFYINDTSSGTSSTGGAPTESMDVRLYVENTNTSSNNAVLTVDYVKMTQERT